MRAKKGYDVSTIAKINGGGGHVGAAAFLSHNDLTKIKDDILKQFTTQLSKTIIVKPKLF